VIAKRVYDAKKHRNKPTVSNTQRERDCLAYVTGMPGAFQLCLNAGDFALYRSSAWHIGNYVPYRKRATIHDFCGTPEWSDHIRTRVVKKDEAMARLKTAL
jgi:hypothetical protein